MALDRDITYVVKVRDETEKALKGIRGNFATLSADFRKVGIGMSAVGAIGTTAIITLAKRASDLEQLNISFETMLGNAEAATATVKDLSDFAAKTPFTLPGVENAARQLLAVGFNAEELIPTLKSVGDVAAGLGRGEEGLQRLILNLGQVRTQGKLTGRELRDFAVLGVPLIQELADMLGVTKEEINELTAAGEITDAIVTQAFRNMTDEGGRFADLMGKQATTLQGQFSNLQDSITLLTREIGQPLQEPLKNVIGTVQQMTAKIGEFIKNNPEVAKFGAYVLLIGTAFLAIVGPLLTVIGTLTFFAGLIGVGGALAVALGGLVLLVSAVVTHWEAMRDNFIGTGELIIQAMRGAFETVRDVVSGTVDFLMAKFEAFVERVKALLASLESRARSVVSGLTFGLVGGQERAVGGFTSSPFVTVGEQGPEIVRLPRGSFVFNARDSERLSRGGSEDGRQIMQTVNVNMGGVVVRNEADESRLAEKIARAIQLQQLRAA